MECTISREWFESASVDLVQRTLMTVGGMLIHAGLGVEDIDNVLLVGGSTRIPLVQRCIAEFFGREPTKSVHPDEAVALGAAILAALLTPGTDSDVLLLDVLPQSIGRARDDGSLEVLFPKFTKLPARKELDLPTTLHNQRSVDMVVYQGESPVAARNTPLGLYEFVGLRPALAGQVTARVTLHLDAEGILSLEAHDLDTGEALDMHKQEVPQVRQRTQANPTVQPDQLGAAPPPPVPQRRPPPPPASDDRDPLSVTGAMLAMGDGFDARVESPRERGIMEKVLSLFRR